MTDPDAGALLLAVRRDQAELIHGEGFRRHRSIETVADRRYGEGLVVVRRERSWLVRGVSAASG